MSILRSAFPITPFYKASDLRHELSRLHTVLERTAATNAKQIEEVLVAEVERLNTLLSINEVGTEPDATVASGVPGRSLYPEYRDFDRAYRIAERFAEASSDSLTVIGDIKVQVQHLLEARGWTFAAPV